jgi:hypothetical protein
MAKAKAIGGEAPTNGAEATILTGEPYSVAVRLVGTADILLHAYNCEAVEAKSKAAKGSAAKKTDDIESYVRRCHNGTIGVPGVYIRQALVNAAKYRQDPRSPRKSAMDLFKAGLIVEEEVCSLGAKAWDYEHKCRVVVQRSAISRVRPAFRAGWSINATISVLLPEYIDADVLHDTLSKAGRLVGIGDFRPTYGRFRVDGFEVM